MNKQRGSRKHANFGVGLISLLLLFSGMLFIVISLMGIATLSQSLALHEKIKETNTAAVKAENEITLKLQEIDNALLELQQSEEKGQYLEEAYILLEKLGCELDKANKTASFMVAIDARRAWKTEISLQEFDASLRYVIIGKQIIQTENWAPEEDINLL